MRANYNILIIDDNIIDQIVTKKLLMKTLDITKVSTLSSGSEGIKWLNNYKRSPNELLIILLDVNMPVMGGFEFLAVYDLLSEEVKKGTQIFMLSSTLDPYDITIAKNNKYVKALLSKPIQIKEFSNLIYFNS